VVARVCLNMLHTRESRREEPLDVHMPDPIISHEDRGDPEQEALLADSVGPALLVVLDTLTPAERLTFVLHDMFAVPFEEIAPMIERSPAAARQLASHARRRAKGAPRLPTLISRTSAQLAGAVQQWAFCSLNRSRWAREFYDAQRGRGKTHHAALRARGNRWLEVLWHCLRKSVRYDEAVHVANRNRASARPPEPVVDKGCLSGLGRLRRPVGAHDSLHRLRLTGRPSARVANAATIRVSSVGLALAISTIAWSTKAGPGCHRPTTTAAIQRLTGNSCNAPRRLSMAGSDHKPERTEHEEAQS
jgi:hypothetical protein